MQRQYLRCVLPEIRSIELAKVRVIRVDVRVDGPAMGSFPLILRSKMPADLDRESVAATRPDVFVFPVFDAHAASLGLNSRHRRFAIASSIWPTFASNSRTKVCFL